MIYDVVVVGSGFSAIATVCNLVELLPGSSSVAVVGDDPGFGRGTAYRTELYLHRLNVPAGRMSLFADRPNEFVEWLREHNRPLGRGDFASRQDYGLYVRDTLAGLLRSKRSRCKVDFIKAKATGCIERYSTTLAFLLENGGEIAGRSVVLCLGVGNAKLPVDTSRLSSTALARIIENPWRLSWLQRVKADDNRLHSRLRPDDDRPAPGPMRARSAWACRRLVQAWSCPARSRPGAEAAIGIRYRDIADNDE